MAPADHGFGQANGPLAAKSWAVLNEFNTMTMNGKTMMTKKNEEQQGEGLARDPFAMALYMHLSIPPLPPSFPDG
jgi:hypothetical protein